MSCVPLGDPEIEALQRTRQNEEPLRDRGNKLRDRSGNPAILRPNGLKDRRLCVATLRWLCLLQNVHPYPLRRPETSPSARRLTRPSLSAPETNIPAFDSRCPAGTGRTIATSKGLDNVRKEKQRLQTRTVFVKRSGVRNSSRRALTNSRAYVSRTANDCLSAAPPQAR